MGSIIGSILANIMNVQLLSKINSLVENFFSDRPNFFGISKFDLLIEEFFKHGKIIFFIWLMAFIPWGKIFVYVALLIKGICLGFSSSIIFSMYKWEALAKTIKYVLPQNFFLLLIIIFISHCALTNASSTKHKNNMFEYFFALVISMMCTFLILLIEIYLLA